MRLPKLHWEHSGLTVEALRQLEREMKPELARMKASIGYGEEHASVNLPVDPHYKEQCKRLAKKHSNASLLIVIGIGGSDLGTIAVQEAILGKNHNLSSDTQVLYADNVDPIQISAIRSHMRSVLKANKKVVLNVICKSGGTTETIANFEVLLQELKRHRKTWKNYVIATTGKDSRLWHLAESQGFETLDIPENVGGRYSVFSPVGLFPLSLLGINIDALLKGAARMRAKCLEPAGNPAIIRAAMLYGAWRNGRNIADNFLFKTDLESIGKWYRQLMGESIGKEWNKAHESRLWMGMTPTVSIGSTDLHSMAQLYFGGPQDKFHTLITVKEEGLKVPRWSRYDALVPNIQGKDLSKIMDSIVGGVTSVLRKQGRPFCLIELQDGKEESIGALLQLFMFEMIYLAHLLDVNPFDQPNVEAYKIETKRLLSR